MKKIFIILMIMISMGFVFAQGINQGIVDSHPKVNKNTSSNVETTWEIEIKVPSTPWFSTEYAENVVINVYSNYPINVTTDDFCKSGYLTKNGKMVVSFYAKKDFRNKIIVRNEKTGLVKEFDITKKIESRLREYEQMQKYIKNEMEKRKNEE